MVDVLAPVLAATALSVALATALARSLTRSGAAAHRGGITIGLAWLVILAGIYVAGPAEHRIALRQIPLPEILIAGAVIFVLGAWDDLRTVSAPGKILAQALAATIVAGAGITIAHVTVSGTTWSLGPFAITATVIWIVAITTAFNQLDDLDSLATWIAIVGGVICAAIVVVRGDTATAIVLAALVGALAGFLPYTLVAAKLPLGSSGSLLTGFVLAVTAITGLQKSATALAVGALILIFALPIVEILDWIVRVRAERRRKRATRTLHHGPR